MTPQMSIAEATAKLTAPGAPFETEVVEIRGIPTRVWKNAIPTLRALVDGMAAFRERDFLVYEEDRLTYGETLEQIGAVGAWLAGEAGIERGDRVAIAMRNQPEWVVAFLAATAIGAIAVPLNAWWTRDELAYALADSGARVLFADSARADLARELDGPAVVVVARRERALAGRELDFAEIARKRGTLPTVSIAPDDDATIFYTSGTTGQPKGAIGTHRNLITNIDSGAFAQARSALRRGDPVPVQGPTTPQRALLLSVPLFHVTGCHSYLARAAALGNKLVLMYKWDPERALELIERERINVMGGVPSMVWQVMESPDFEKRDTSSITNLGYGGAPASPDLVRRISERFPGAVAANGYGMTETSATSTQNNGEDYFSRPDSVGPPVGVVDLRVVGPNGEDLPPGEVGELYIKGPNIVRGYFGKPEATAETFTDGWCRSGDLVRRDAEGFVYIVDRAKDMLIRGGENIYCVEVEDALYSHAGVMDAAVVGIDHALLGEEVGAVVQRVPGADPSEAELMAHVAERLARFKVPVRISVRSEPLPRNANGKIDKRALRAELNA